MVPATGHRGVGSQDKGLLEKKLAEHESWPFARQNQRLDQNKYTQSHIYNVDHLVYQCLSDGLGFRKCLWRQWWAKFLDH